MFFEVERTPVKQEKKISRQKNQPSSQIQNSSRLNSTENNTKKKTTAQKPEKRSVSPSFYFHKLEDFETVMKRLNQKGCSAEKPRKPFH